MKQHINIYDFDNINFHADGHEGEIRKLKLIVKALADEINELKDEVAELKHKHD